jgi:alpha-glucosidase (family GH31 glycosyl hydrolase)
MGAFKENIQMVCDPLLGTYENIFLANDTDGYDFFGGEEQSDELYIRWVQFSMFNPITNIFSTSRNKTGNLPYKFSKNAQNNFLKYANLKSSLFPYIYTYAHKARITEKKMIEGYIDHELQYNFGNEMLVAPVYEKGMKERSVFFEKGFWIDYETNEIIEGGKVVMVKCPLDKIPVFVRDGSIIPLRYSARNIESGNNNHLKLKIFSHAEKSGSFTLYEDDCRSNDYINNKVACTEIKFKKQKNNLIIKIQKTIGTYDGQLSDRSYTVEVIGLKKKPKMVTFKAPISYDWIDNILTIKLEKTFIFDNNEIKIDF